MGPPRKVGKFLQIFSIFPARAKKCLKWHEMGPGGFCPTNLDLADILGDTDFDFENLDFWDFWIPDFWISRFLDSQIQGCHLVIFVRGGMLDL